MLGWLPRGALQRARVSGEARVFVLCRSSHINVAHQRSFTTAALTCIARKDSELGVLQTVAITQQRRAMAESAGGVSEWESVAENLAAVNAKIAATVARLPHRKETPPRLVAVSKTKPMDAIIAAHAAGQRCFGENYVQELVAKANDPTAPAGIEWHFIGTLQSNKAKVVAAIPNLSMVETITSEKQATLLDKALATSERAAPLPILVQVNTSGEENKGGVEPAACASLVKIIREGCPHLDFRGFMTIGMYDRVTGPGEVNPDFALLIKVRDEVCAELGIDPAAMEVSMGMSGDFEHAIELGSTNVRVGSTIFGGRH